MNMHEGAKESPEQTKVRKLKRLLGMAESLRKEIEECILTGTDDELGPVAIHQTRAIVEYTKVITEEDSLDVITPSVPDTASNESKAKAAQIALAQYVGYAKSVIAEYEPPPGANVKESVNRAVDGIERGFESLAKVFDQETGRRLAESIRDAVENAIGSKFTSKQRHENPSESSQEPEDAEFTEEPSEEQAKDQTRNQG